MGASDLKIGTIVHFFDEESHPPKPKFSIIVGISEDHFHIATVYINSQINVNYISPELMSLQYEIDQIRYKSFLKRNSFVDCSDIKHRMRSSFLQSLDHGGDVVGRLTAEDCEKVLSLIKSASTIPVYYLRLYGII